MAITNVITNTSKVFKDIIVQNHTDMNLNNLHFSYKGKERPVLKITDLPKMQQIKKSILLDYLSEPTDLFLIYNINDKEETKVLAYEQLSHDDLRTLTLTILNDKNGLKVNSSIECE